MKNVDHTKKMTTNPGEGAILNNYLSKYGFPSEIAEMRNKRC